MDLRLVLKIIIQDLDQLPTIQKAELVPGSIVNKVSAVADNSLRIVVTYKSISSLPKVS